MARARSAQAKPAATKPVRLYTLEVSLSCEVPTAAPALAEVSRTLQLRGDQTLEELHRAIGAAFEHEGDFSYEFELDGGPLHPEGRRYVLPAEFDVDREADNPAAGRVTETTLDSLGLRPGQSLGYWPDTGDDWWHPILVRQIKDATPRGRYPRVTKRVGDSPFAGGATAVAPGGTTIGTDEGADTACLVGEVHLSKGEYHKAIEAFTRALAARPTADAYDGRAKAYLALAAQDGAEAERLRAGRSGR